MKTPNPITTLTIAVGLAWCDIVAPVFGSEPPVVEATPAGRLPGNQRIFYSTVAANPKGEVVVAGRAIEGRTVVWTSRDHGKTFGEPHLALPREDLSTSHKDVRLQSDDVGGFYLSIGAKQAETRPGPIGFLWKSVDAGNTWRLLNRSNDDEETDLSFVAVSPNGNQLIHVVPGVHKLTIFSSHNRGEDWTHSVLGTSSSGLPFDAVIHDLGRVAILYRTRIWPSTWGYNFATTEDSGRTWKQCSAGLIGECMPAHPKQYAVIDGIYHSGAALDENGNGTYFVLAIEREWTKQGERAHVRLRTSSNGTDWSEPCELSDTPATVKAFPAIAATGNRVHALWLEADGDGWGNLVYRGSLDAGKTWSDAIVVSTTDRPTSSLTSRGFRKCASHFFESNMSEDGTGTAHVVWGAAGLDSWEGEPWHATVHLHSGR